MIKILNNKVKNVNVSMVMKMSSKSEGKKHLASYINDRVTQVTNSSIPVYFGVTHHVSPM